MIRNFRVLFYADLTRPFVPPDLDSGPLGGSETALVHVGRGLAAAGWTVVVAAHPRELAGSYDEVTYLNVDDDSWRKADPDVVVVFRQLPHVLRRLPGRVRVLWAHDHIGIYPELPRGVRRSALAAAWQLAYPLFGRRAPMVVAVSEWLRGCFVRYAGWPDQAVHAIGNAIDPAFFGHAGPGQPSDSNLRVAYTSVPERGLPLLVEQIMPLIWRMLPEVELHVFSYQPLDKYRSLHNDAHRGVVFRGGLRQRELARDLAQFDLWLYPTNFPETSCIAAMEAQAAGVPVVSSRRFALRETVEDGRTGILIDGPVGSQAYLERFAGAAIELLKDPLRRREMGRQARERMLNAFVWDKVVQRWDGYLRRLALSG
jgi:glycosyltransferase involved in cell wall biosynthesis